MNSPENQQELQQRKREKVTIAQIELYIQQDFDGKNHGEEVV